jgi:GNAT superfamily N-acetyltransferase
VENGAKLARSLETAHGWCIGQYAASVARRRSESSAAVLPVNSGVCICTSVSGPFNFAVGMGLDGPISLSEFDEVESFFRSRGLSPRIDVNPYTDASLCALLHERGYYSSEITSVLALSLQGELPAAQLPENTELRWAEERDCDDWVNVLVKCFFVTDPGPERRANLAALFCVPNSLNVMALIDGELAGIAGGMIPDDLEVAAIFGSSVLPQFRNRGIHGAMLRARCDRAKDAGCKVMAVTATPGGVSERNLIRHGFVPCYEKATYVAAS